MLWMKDLIASKWCEINNARNWNRPACITNAGTAVARIASNNVPSSARYWNTVRRMRRLPIRCCKFQFENTQNRKTENVWTWHVSKYEKCFLRQRFAQTLRYSGVFQDRFLWVSKTLHNLYSIAVFVTDIAENEPSKRGGILILWPSAKV